MYFPMSRTRRRNRAYLFPELREHALLRDRERDVEPRFVRDGGADSPSGLWNGALVVYGRRFKRRGYCVLGMDMVKNHGEDELDIGHTAGHALRLTRRRLIQRDWLLWRNGEFESFM